MLFRSNNQTVDFFRSDSEHTHNHDDFKENATNKICGELEDTIRSMFDHSMKPKAMLVNLVKKGFEPPQKSKLSKHSYQI